MSAIIINDGSLQIPAQPGSSLLAALAAQKIFLPSACGGRGVCGYCRIKVADAALPFTPAELRLLTDAERAAGVRLACQLPAQPMRVFIPPVLLSREGLLPCICAEVRPLTDDIRAFRLRLPARGALNYQPGQYIQLRIPPDETRPQELFRAYSIASDPADRQNLELIIRRAPNGIGSRYCFDVLKKGDLVHLHGPYGDFLLKDTKAPILFIAGGSGMAPIKCMLHHLCNQKSVRPIRFFFGARSPADLFYLELMRDFEKNLADFKFIPSVAALAPEADSAKAALLDAFRPEKGLVTEVVARRMKSAAAWEAYLCGGPAMIDAALPVLHNLGFKPENVFYDKFA